MLGQYPAAMLDASPAQSNKKIIIQALCLLRNPAISIHCAQPSPLSPAQPSPAHSAQPVDQTKHHLSSLGWKLELRYILLF